MKNKKATNKQILQAHSQSIKYLKEAKRFDDEQKVKDTTSKKRGVMKFILEAQREIIQGYYIRIFNERPELETILQWLEKDLEFLSQEDAIEEVKDILDKNQQPI
jgi:hypothetical protein